MKSKKVSIIVPVYNGMKYLETIVHSILTQTYYNLEVIFMDDLSTDGSYEFLEKCAKQDLRIKVYSTKKKCGCAVKSQYQGFKYLTGDYYFYASQDDFFDDNLIEELMRKALENNADIVLPNMVLFNEGEKNQRFGIYPISQDYNFTLCGKEAFELSLDWSIHGFALRKMSLFGLSGFGDEYFNSEEFYFRKMYLYANKIAFADTNFYYRQDNPNAITKKFNHFHSDILCTDFLLFKLLIENSYSRKVIHKHYVKLSINWLRYFKRFATNKYSLKEREQINRNLKFVLKGIFQNLKYIW